MCRAPIALVLIALVAAGCGGGSKSKPLPPKPDPAPIGHLSQAEYAAIVREYTLLHPLQQSDATPQALKRGRAACGAAAHPNTQLMVLVRRDCMNAVQFFKAIGDLTKSPQSSDSYDEIAVATRAIVSNALQINSELSRREITGLCARSIGITPPQVRSLQDADAAAINAADAVNAADEASLLQAQHDLSNALASDNTPEPLPGIKTGCRTKAPAPPKPGRHNKPNPHGLPRVPPPGQGVAA